MLPFAKIQIQNVHSPPNITIFARLRLASNDHSTIHWIRPCKIKKKQASIERAISITKRYNATSEALAASRTKGHRAHFPFVQGNRQTRFRIRGRGVVETHPSRTAAPRTTSTHTNTRLSREIYSFTRHGCIASCCPIKNSPWESLTWSHGNPLTPTHVAPINYAPNPPPSNPTMIKLWKVRSDFNADCDQRLVTR